MNAGVNSTSTIAGYRTLEVLCRDYPLSRELWQFCDRHALARKLHLSEVIEADSLKSSSNNYALVMEEFGRIRSGKSARIHPID